MGKPATPSSSVGWRWGSAGCSLTPELPVIIIISHSQTSWEGVGGKASSFKPFISPVIF